MGSVQSSTFELCQPNPLFSLILTFYLEDQKSYSQQAADTTRDASNKAGDTANQAGDQSKSMLGQVQDTLNNAAKSVQDTIAGNTPNSMLYFSLFLVHTNWLCREVK